MARSYLRNSRKQTVCNIDHCRHRHGRLCCVLFFEFLGAAHHHARKLVCTSSVFYAKTTTTTARKHVRCSNTHNNKQNDNHQSSHHLNDGETRIDRNDGGSWSSSIDNDNNPPQRLQLAGLMGSAYCGHCFRRHRRSNESRVWRHNRWKLSVSPSHRYWSCRLERSSQDAVCFEEKCKVHGHDGEVWLDRRDGPRIRFFVRTKVHHDAVLGQDGNNGLGRISNPFIGVERYVQN